MQITNLPNATRSTALSMALLAMIQAACTPASTQVDSMDDSEELRLMYVEDQTDRQAESVDWSVVGPRDRARLARVKELFASDSLYTANDYYHAAMILQHGAEPEDYLLAHEFCVVAIIKGRNDKATRWLAAASEDRFLMNLDRPQRFATQFRSVGVDGPVLLYKVDSSVTDGLRHLMDARTLEGAKAQEADFNK